MDVGNCLRIVCGWFLAQYPEFGSVLEHGSRAERKTVWELGGGRCPGVTPFVLIIASSADCRSVRSQVLGPALYGTIYVNTVATFPKTIYAAALGATFVSGTLLALIRLPKEVDHVETTFEDPED